MSPASPGTQPGNRPNRLLPPAALPGKRRARADGARGSRSPWPPHAVPSQPRGPSPLLPQRGAGPKRRPYGAPPARSLRRSRRRRRPPRAGPNGGLTAACAPPPPPPLPLRRLLLPLCGAAPGSARRAGGGAGRADNVCRARGSARRGLQQREPLPLPRSGAAFSPPLSLPILSSRCLCLSPRFVRPGAVPFPWGRGSEWTKGGKRVGRGDMISQLHTALWTSNFNVCCFSPFSFCPQAQKRYNSSSLPL